MKTVLIAEDDQLTLRLVDHILTKNGYRSLPTTTGLEALRVLSQEGAVDLIIADVLMPEMDGLELIAEVRGNHAWRNTPIIVSTVLAEVGAQERAAKLGCNYYLIKPVSEDELLLNVQRALHEDQSGAYLQSEPSYRIDAIAKSADVEMAFTHGLTPRRLELVEQLMSGEVTVNRAQVLEELMVCAQAAGAGRAVDIIRQLTGPYATQDKHKLMASYVVLFHELASVEEALITA